MSSEEIAEQIAGLATRVVADGTAQGFTVAVAESLTGGLLAAAITSVPGASNVFRGSVTAYATDIKASVLGVDADLLAREGAVHPEVARQMADGVRRLFGATVGLATTGVAGPTEQDGKPVGLVYVGYASSAREVASSAEELHLDGDREAIRAQAVLRALSLVFSRPDPEA
ncbi:CinA domain protein [Catenulispora acidiphila DSM 44928]|uniref:CinA domain protein n=1 Tax=Catenulispora acidiphila (strain DSM 44928 / JCM 14897 / NBRC 102108 / NRRL B-24433 / ID139908) TaxID=479433 RepID=C7QF93_CATAD|nr:nicotinamide-nucleotide amidohydrolase family protein [Catenulispora acidiphila]ACU76670.1 CinA domain protein [Catenulispora acidiphila DSM 44928]